MTSLIHLVRAYYKHSHSNHQNQWVRSGVFFPLRNCCPIGPLLQGHGVLRGNEGEKASREMPLFTEEFLSQSITCATIFPPPTGTSKQDLSGMKIRVAQKCTGLVMPKYNSAESQINPSFIEFFQCCPSREKKKKPQRMIPNHLIKSIWLQHASQMQPANLTDLVRPPYLTRPVKKKKKKMKRLITQ